MYSYSQLDSFQHCQKQYQFDYVLKEEKKFVGVVLDGTITHKFLELLWGRDWDTVTKMVIEQYGMYDKIKRLKEYLQTIVGETFFKHTVDVEKPINFTIDGKEFIGYIDRLDKRDDGTYEIIDYKYGVYEYSAYNLSNSLQVDLYSYAVMQLYNVNQVFFTYYNIKQNTQVTRLVKKQSIRLPDIISLVNGIENAKAKNYFPPQVSSFCAYCFFNQHCDDYKLWIEKDFLLTPQSSFNEIVQTLDSFSNKKKVYDTAERKLKQLVYNYMMAKGLTEYNTDNKRIILTKNSVIIR